MATRNSKPIQNLVKEIAEELAHNTEQHKKSLNDAVEKLNKNRAGKAKSGTPEPLTKNELEAKQMPLEFWPDQVRGVPNAALRGSLFSVAKIRTTAKKRELLASVNNIEIRFKGERFNQTDLDVMEMLLHYARGKTLEITVEFSATKMLEDLGRGIGGADHDQLKEEIARLMGGVVEITWKAEKKTFSGTIVSNAYRDDKTERYIVTFDPKMLSLYEDGFTYVDWEQRRALGNHSLAKWLHGFYCSHAEPFPYKVKTIKDLCGSTTARLGDFRKMLRASLDRLKDIGAITAWDIAESSDLVTVKRPATNRAPKLKAEKK